MSGGFFRGTSADQDTRFSNKQAKLLKSQKFAPELDHLVDMTKVKMDVVRPWIANRVTELLGFEDEVLINFIYGLLDGKEVNGKEVQISLTGFMEKNTGKFMKELWILLLSAQKNASGVPQQFLDAKEEETKKKKAEADRITNEIQKKKEKEARELEEEKVRKMDGGSDISKATNNDALEPTSKHKGRRTSSGDSEDEKERKEMNGLRGQNRVSRSPRSAEHSPSSPKKKLSRSISKSISNSRGYSGERHRSSSISRSPQPRGRSISSERVYRSTRRRSITPRRRYPSRVSVSPSRHRSPYIRRRSRSRSYRRSITPVRRKYRSPLRRRSPSPVRRRSPSLVRRRSPSPVRRKFRSPVRRRSPSPLSLSPVRRRSPSTVRRRSPSPVRRRSPSPVRRRSPSPVRRRSPSPMRRRSPSPIRRRRRRSPLTPQRESPSPVRHRSPISGSRRSPTPSRRRSPSPYGVSSPSPARRLSPSPVRKKFVENRRRSPVRSSPERIREKPNSTARRPPSSLRSPQRDPKDHTDSNKRVPFRSPSSDSSILSKSPPDRRKRSPSEDKRSSSPRGSLVRHTREQMARDGSQSPQQERMENSVRRDCPEMRGGKERTNYSREDRDHKSKPSEKISMHPISVGKQKDSKMITRRREEHSPERSTGRQANESRGEIMDSRKRGKDTKSEKISERVVHPEVIDTQKPPTSNKHSTLAERQQASYSGEDKKAYEKNRSQLSNTKDTGLHHKSENSLKSDKKIDQKDRSDSFDSGSEDSDKYRSDVKQKRKHKRSDRHEKASDGDYSYDSQTEGRKEAKRRRKEEKRLRKEEKRRRHEEKRRRKREERHAEKLKVRSKNNLTPTSDVERNEKDANASDGEDVALGKSRSNVTEETENEQKKLEIELRKKALESLRAKKGIDH